MRKRKGFTLMELIIVVIIIGILAAIGVPQFFRIAERGRSSEAIALLGSLKSAQMRYASEHGTTTDDLDELDMQASNLKYFDVPNLTAQADPINNTGVVIADMDRNDINNAGYGNYVLEIQVDGTIICTDAGGTVDPCPMLGY